MSLVAGIIEVPPLLFAVLSLIGTAVWVTSISLIGYGIGSGWHSIAHGLAVAGYVIALVVVLAIVSFIAHRLRKVRLQRQRAARYFRWSGGGFESDYAAEDQLTRRAQGALARGAVGVCRSAR